MLKANRVGKISIAALLLTCVFLFPRFAFSATLSSLSDVLSTLKVSTVANHTFTFTLSSGNTLAAGETITITFPSSSFSTTGLANSDPLDYDIRTDTGGTPVDEAIVAAGACASNDAIEITSVTATVITFTACGSYTATPATAIIEIEIGTHASLGGGGDTQITNPASANTYVIALTAGGDTASQLAVAILGAAIYDDVTISATVDPTLSITIEQDTCNLGVLSASQVDTCNYDVTVSTNAVSGYKSTIKDDGNLRQGAVDIDDTAGGNIVAGTEEYGVATSDSGQTIAQDATCTDPGDTPQVATAITTTPQQFAASTGPVSNEATTLCHAASITGTTAAGTYSHIVTIVVTATF